MDTNEHTRLVVVICEEALESLIQSELTLAGAKGYTVCKASGRGNRGERDAHWSLSANIRIEILCNAKTAEQIINTVYDKFSENYGLVVYAMDVDVKRTHKF